MRKLLPGLGLAAALAALGWGIGALVPTIGPVTASLALGVLAGGRIRADARVAPGVAWAASRVLGLTIALLGLGVDLGGLVGAGPGLLVALIAVVGGGIALTAAIARALGLGAGLGLLIGVGNGVCGTAAIAAAAPAVRHEPGDAGVAIGVIHAVGLVGLVLVPALARAVGLGSADAGVLVGATLQALGHVLAAAYALGPEVGDVATAVKMARVALLVPVVLALSALGRRGGRVSLLWELVAFAAAAAAAATGRVPAALLDGADLVADALLGVAMAAIGAGLDLGHLRRAAPRALLAGALGFALQVGAVTAWLLLSASAAP